MIAAGAVSVRGKLRVLNEDRAFIQDVVISDGAMQIKRDSCMIAAVFDGVSAGDGGGSAATIASSALCEIVSLHDECLDSCPEAIQALTQYMSRADSEVRAFAFGRNHSSATTVGGLALCKDGSVISFSVGDTRVFRFRDGVLTALATPDTPAGELERSGGLPELVSQTAEALGHVITKAIGCGTTFEPPRRVGMWLLGDSYLICSDGVSDVLDDSDMSRVLEQGISPLEEAQKIVRQALLRETSDNVSTIVIGVIEDV